VSILRYFIDDKIIALCATCIFIHSLGGFAITYLFLNWLKVLSMLAIYALPACASRVTITVPQSCNSSCSLWCIGIMIKSPDNNGKV
jgi:hypothetical protein